MESLRQRNRARGPHTGSRPIRKYASRRSRKPHLPISEDVLLPPQLLQRLPALLANSVAAAAGVAAAVPRRLDCVCLGAVSHPLRFTRGRPLQCLAPILAFLLLPRLLSGERFTAGGEEAAAKWPTLRAVFSPRISSSGKSNSKPHACSVYAHDTHTHVTGSVRPRSPYILCGRCVCAGGLKRKTRESALPLSLTNVKKTYAIIKERRRLATGERPTYKTAAKH